MIKGTPQLKRNNAWHLRHTKQKRENKLSHIRRAINYSLGVPQTKRNEKMAMERMEKQKERFAKQSIFQKIWRTIRYYWIMSGFKAKIQIRKLFGNNQQAHA